MDAPVKTASIPTSTVTLVTSNELLGLFFRHFLGEHSQVQLCVAAFGGKCQRTDLWLLDAGQCEPQALAEFIEQHDDGAPFALVNITPAQAEWLVDRHPTIRGVFYSQATREQLLSGIMALIEGGDWLPRALMERMLAELRRARQQAESKTELTLREREILSLAGKGLSNAEIAAQLCLSPHTIKSHIHNLLRKLGASNRAEAAFLLRDRLDWSESCRA